MPQAGQPVPASVTTGSVRDIKAESKEWEPPPQVVATPHTTQHPLDYIQEQLKQANLQVYKKGSHEDFSNNVTLFTFLKATDIMYH